VRRFTVDRIAYLEFDEAVAWYEKQEPGLGFEFIEEIDRVLARIETHEKFVTKPLAIIDRGVVRREFVKRFPYVVIFVETETMRRVIMIRRGNVDPRRWKSRIEL
jgi:toxin ParE1/3/4